ncbi:MAG: ATP-binding protein [Planctomycetes bacterium]|nr:ATP-binding protein [Planctomycetota bacterium]
MTLDLLAFDFLPHGTCYLWEPALVWTHAASDVLIGAAYVSIFLTLVYLIRRIRDIPFEWMYLAFAVFIVTCGGTHLMEVWNTWRADYWPAAWLKVLTAVASVGTALLLPPLVPKAVALAEAARAAHERGLALERAHAELGQLLDRTRELERVKAQFFANVSHELRTPLTLVLGPAEAWLGRGDAPPELRRDLELIARSARTVLKHVNDLLDVARLEAGKLAPRLAEVDLARLVRATTAHFEGHARQRGVDLAVDAPGAVEAQVDADMIERVLVNLLSNALKFTPEGGRVRVVLAEEEGRRRRLEVRDSGPGIPAEERDRVFERFEQLDAGDARRFGGTGLGLAIARDLVAVHEGTIAVDSAPEGGARFVVTLPRAAAVAGAVAPAEPDAPAGPSPSVQQALDALRAPASTPAAPAAPAGERASTVLVVEDDPDMRRFVAEGLAADHRVEVAADGQEGLERALGAPPDLVLTDVMMPGMSGEQLVEALRARPAFDRVPIVLLTAKADDELRVRLLRGGAQDYLSKPFSLEELRARVANLVTIKRARDVLEGEVERREQDLAGLAAEVAAAKRDLRRALDAAQAARDFAEQASRAKGDLLNLVSHELRTPLSTLLLQLELIERGAGAGPERQADAVRRMRRSAGRLLELVESLLHVARLESGRVEVRPEEVDVGALVADLLDELGPRAEQKGLALVATVPPDLPRLRSDGRLVRTILVNLAGNAVKFTERGRVELAAAPAPEGGVIVRVSDTGPGIRLADQALVFEPFRHVETVEHKTTPGMGLGLTIARELARGLGGRIELTSAVGEGSTFTVLLPPLER